MNELFITKLIASNIKLNDLTKRLDQKLKQKQLPNTFSILILSILKRNNNLISIKELRRKLKKEKPYISITLRNLEEEKLIQLREDQTDRREKTIKITKKGDAKLKKALKFLGKEIEYLLNQLSISEQELLNETIKALYTILSDLD